MIENEFWTNLGLSLVALVPLAILYLVFSPKRYRPAKDKAPLGHGRSPARSAGRILPGAARTAPLGGRPGKPERIPNHDETFREWFGRSIRNAFVLDLYMLIPLAGAVAVIVAIILVAILK